jgi:signal transduction histidine kinase
MRPRKFLDVATIPRPTAWQDWAVPAFLFLWTQIEIWFTGLSMLAGPPWVFSLIAFGCAVALTFRRTRPLLSASTVMVLLLLPLSVGWMAQSMSFLLMLVVAVFACARYGQRPQAYLALPLATGAVLLVTLVNPEMEFADTWPWSLNTVWIFGLGAAFRHEHRLRQQVADASAARAEASGARDRLRMAREIHDVLSHCLAVVVVQAEVADTYLVSDVDKSREAIRNLASTARLALNDTRKLVGLLRDPDDGDPRPMLPGLADVPGLVNRVRDSGLPVSLHIGDNPPSLTAQINSTTYRIVQESLTNVLRHAGQVPTQVGVEFDPGRVTIEVLNGPGHLAMTRDAQGHGLLGMHERVLECGGELTSGPDLVGGFTVKAVLPVTAA